jgi:hypothetical protein
MLWILLHNFAPRPKLVQDSLHLFKTSDRLYLIVLSLKGLLAETFHVKPEDEQFS